MPGGTGTRSRQCAAARAWPWLGAVLLGAHARAAWPAFRNARVANGRQNGGVDATDAAQNLPPPARLCESPRAHTEGADAPQGTTLRERITARALKRTRQLRAQRTTWSQPSRTRVCSPGSIVGASHFYGGGGLRGARQPSQLAAVVAQQSAAAQHRFFFAGTRAGRGGPACGAVAASGAHRLLWTLRRGVAHDGGRERVRPHGARALAASCGGAGQHDGFHWQRCHRRALPRPLLRIGLHVGAGVNRRWGSGPASPCWARAERRQRCRGGCHSCVPGRPARARAP